MPSIDEPTGRWVTRPYAVRAVLAVLGATLLIGYVNGSSRAAEDDGLVMLNGIEGRTAIFWYRIQFEVVMGLGLAALPSLLAVLAGTRPTPAAVIRRLLVGPLIAGTLLCAFSAVWGWAALHPALAMTATACVGFVLIGWLFGLLEAPPSRISAPQAPHTR